MDALSEAYWEYRDQLEILLRLCVAAAFGMAIGLNRDLYGKPIGMRTLGLVALGSAILVLSGSAYGNIHYDQDALSRVVQGILTGLGFLGAGVIIRGEGKQDVQGLTTASTVWLAAAFGVSAGLGAWFVTIAGNGLALLLLVFGKPLERKLHRLIEGKAKLDDSESEG